MEPSLPAPYPPRLANGPRGFDVFRTLFRRRENPLEVFQELFGRYGDNVFFKLGSVSLLFTRSDDVIDAMCADRDDAFIKGYGYEVLRPAMGNGLFTANGEAWRHSRKMAQPAFHANRYSRFLKVVDDAVGRRVSEWGKNLETEVPLLSALTELTLEIICRALFGDDLGENLGAVTEAITTIVRECDHQGVSALRAFDLSPIPSEPPISYRLYHALPNGSRRRLAAATAVIRKTAQAVIDRRRKEPEAKDDLLAMYLDQELSDELLLDEVMTMMLVGHETTASALAWLFIELGKNPKWIAPIRSDAETPLSVHELSLEDLMGQRRLNAVWSETLRLYPPLWRFSRQATKDLAYGGVRIPKKTVVAAFTYCNHRDARHWVAPDSFLPERFLDGTLPTGKFTYLPFGQGGRSCIGKYFALMEALVIVPRILEAFDFSIQSEGPIGLSAQLSLRPTGDVRATFRRRPGLA